MPFGVISEVNRRMDVLDGVIIVEGKGQFWGWTWASHCNWWRLCYVGLTVWERRALPKLLWGGFVFCLLVLRGRRSWFAVSCGVHVRPNLSYHINDTWWPSPTQSLSPSDARFSLIRWEGSGMMPAPDGPVRPWWENTTSSTKPEVRRNADMGRLNHGHKQHARTIW